MIELGDEASRVLAYHRVPAYLARRFHQICLGVTAEILDGEGLTQLLWGLMVAIAEEPGSGQRHLAKRVGVCLLYTSPSPRDGLLSRMPSSA